MKGRFRSRWWWLALLLVVMPVWALFLLRQSTINDIHPALDELSAVPFGQRWSHPQMLKLRERGEEVVPFLRRVVREKSNPFIRFQLWVKASWPGATKYYSHFPDLDKLTERRSMACQVLRTLGPAGRTAVPEIVAIFKSGDIHDLNSAITALYGIGIDADICDRLGTLLENGQVISESGRSQIVGALGNAKPPTPRTLKVLVAALSDSSPYVQYRAAETLGHLGIRTTEIVSALKCLQSTTTSELTVIASSTALWELEKDASSLLSRVFNVLEGLLTQSMFVEGDSGQGVTPGDQSFMGAGELFRKINLGQPEKTKALALLDAWSDKSKRIFVRMLLLPAMMDLGLPREKCVEVCRTGLSRSEDYYRLQAARLLVMVSEKYSVEEADLDTLINDANLGVRVYAARILWQNKHQAKAVVPILIDSLDRSKHQSYDYAEIQPVALRVLSDIGPGAREAVGPLEKLLSDPNPTIVNLASNALASINR